MKDSYDFSKGVKNPYTAKLKDGYTVTVHYDFTKDGDSQDQEKKKDVSDDDRAYKRA